MKVVVPKVRQCVQDRAFESYYSRVAKSLLKRLAVSAQLTAVAQDLLVDLQRRVERGE